MSSKNLFYNTVIRTYITIISLQTLLRLIQAGLGRPMDDMSGA